MSSVINPYGINELRKKILLDPELLHFEWCSTMLNINVYLFAVNPIEMTEGEEDEDEEEDEDG